MAASDSQRGSSRGERLFDHVVRTLTVAAIVGGVIGFFDLRTQLAVMGQRVERMAQDIADLYTGADARRDLTPVHELLADHESRIRALERSTLRPREMREP